jgi:small conductance mechanosensitive channel
MSWDSIVEWLKANAGSIVGALAILALGYVAAWVAGRVVRIVLTRMKVDATVTKFAARLAHSAILVMAIVATLGKFGVETASFVALLGAIAFAIGFALQGALANFAAGVLILVLRPYKVGDSIGAVPHKGKFTVKGVVSEIQLFTTEVITADNIQLLVPNGIIFAGTIKNRSAYKTRRLEMIVEIGRKAPVDEALRVLQEAIQADKRVLAEPPAEVLVKELKEKCTCLLLRFWVAPSDAEAVEFDLTRRVKDVLDSHNLST